MHVMYSRNNFLVTLFCFPCSTCGGHWKNEKWIPGNPLHYWGENPYSEIWECFYALLPSNEYSNLFLPPLWMFSVIYLALLYVAGLVFYQFLIDDARRRLLTNTDNRRKENHQGSASQGKSKLDQKTISVQNERMGHARAWSMLAQKHTKSTRYLNR